ncbi:MAG: TIGR03905 family TSCPD domain-containing protein [Christensenellales bacterium]|jgi:uncharacterized protein (TIGR03905 family)
MTYKTRGTCSTQIDFEIRDGRVYNVRFTNGCPGNTRGVAALAEGMPAEEVIARCRGIQCHNGTSCPDQLAKALQEALCPASSLRSSSRNPAAEVANAPGA